MTRRDLFRSVLRPAAYADRRDAVRPPYCRDPDRLLALCVGCSDRPCVDACPERIIEIDIEGLPRLDLRRRGCTFCDACAVACPRSVLEVEAGVGIRGRLLLDRGDCLAWHRTLCTSCDERCPEDAILSPAGLEPIVQTDLCNRCGQCVGSCPVGALTVLGGDGM